jgi:hypothetical protein
MEEEQVIQEKNELSNGNGHGKKTLFHMTWSTLKEKDFIDKMGSFYTGGAIPRERDPKKRYHQLLIGYREGMKHRVNWGDIDPIAIKQYVEWRIARERLQH